MSTKQVTAVPEPQRSRIDKVVGSEMLLRREQLGLTAATLAEMLTCPTETVMAIEEGRTRPDPALLLRISDILGLPVMALFTEAEASKG